MDKKNKILKFIISVLFVYWYVIFSDQSDIIAKTSIKQICLNQNQKETNQNKKELFRNIERKKNHIDVKINEYQKIEKTVFGRSSEGGQVVGYFKGGDLVKVTAEFFGEMGKGQTYFYFDEKTPFFIISSDSYYSHPIYEKEPRRISEIVMEKYYSFGNQSACWLVERKEDTTSKESKESEAKKIDLLLKEVSEFRELLQK